MVLSSRRPFPPARASIDLLWSRLACSDESQQAVFGLRAHIYEILTPGARKAPSDATRTSGRSPLIGVRRGAATIAEESAVMAKRPDWYYHRNG